MRPLCTVEKPAFCEMIRASNPSANILCRNTLSIRLGDRFANMKNRIRDELAEVPNICTTADIWSNNKRSYFGVTAHWITDTLQRKSFALACKRFMGIHSYDRIYETLNDVFSEYNLKREQIVATVTDNGSNFVKAFREFSENIHESADIIEISAAENLRGNGQDDVHDDIYEDIDVEVIDVRDLLSQKVEGDHLPPHYRCAAHTLSLVACHDVDTALKDVCYKRLHESTMLKCNALWKASGRPKACETIFSICGKKLIHPCQTRWNSLFDSIQRLMDVKKQLPEICMKLNLKSFRENEIDFLLEFLLIMRPVAAALDKLQGDDAYLAFLLPCIFGIQNTVTEMLQKLRLARPLALAILDGLSKRYAYALCLSSEAEILILASVTHPYFKMHWVPERYKSQVRDVFLRNVPTFSGDTSNNKEPQLQSGNEEFDIFNFRHRVPSHTTVRLEADQYLEDPSASLESLTSFPTVKSMFIRYNTVIPSSAPVERLFSCAGNIFTPQRNGLSDERFEQLLLLKQNKTK